MPWIRRPGIQTDEALFSAGIYGPFWQSDMRVNVFGHDYSIMVMTYVGTLKSRIWSPIFKVFGVSAGSIRIPALLIGALSIWWFYRVLVRTLGPRAAVIGCGLLAADPVYMLTIRCDWGPVALQHALLLGGMLAVIAWWQDRKLWLLGIGFFAFGLAVWDKALFVWSLVGLALATAGCFPRQLLRSIRPATFAVAAISFLIGAWPLILYNLRTHGITFRSNAERDTEGPVYKAGLVRETMEGASLFGFLGRNEWEGPLRTPNRWLERAVIALSLYTGSQQRTVLLWLVVLSLVCLPLVWRQPAARAVAFAVIFMVAVWAQMVPLKNGGTGVHHVILLWPMPVLIVAAVGGALGDRMARPNRWVYGLTAIGMVSGLLVTSTYYRDLLRNGGSVGFTEAIFPAVNYMLKTRPTEVLIAEWGLFDSVRALGGGKLVPNIASEPEINADKRRSALAQISEPRNLFITHTKGNESEAGRTDKIVKFAEANGYRKVNSQVFVDTNGRPIIETFSFQKAP